MSVHEHLLLTRFINSLFGEIFHIKILFVLIARGSLLSLNKGWCYLRRLSLRI